MKRSLIILCFLLIAATCKAGTVSFFISPEPTGQVWTAVNFYECMGTLGSYTYNLVGTITQVAPLNPTTFPTSFTLNNVTAGVHTYTARAYDGQSESVDSDYETVTLNAQPTAPVIIKFTVGNPTGTSP